VEETRTYSAGARGAKVGELLLVALLPSGVETWVLPRSGKVTIGSAHAADVCIPHASVEAAHAELSVGPRVVVVARAAAATVDGISIERGEAAELVIGGCLDLGAVTLVLQRRGAGDFPEPEAEGETFAVGDHEALLGRTLQRAFEVLRKVARGDITVLVVGETGVGKDVVAELLHRASPRARGPFVRVHCAALSPALFESELFGHERGAFTGATVAKPGLLTSANGGTVFLDEVGEIPPFMQVKLLRVLTDRRVLPVGSTTPREVDVRFVAATNRDLAQEVERGAFREDLFYRLSGFTSILPPLRERPEEIVPLARHFLARARAAAALSFDAGAEETLVRHPFPGNVRELRLAVERAAALAIPPFVTTADLGLEPAVEREASETTPGLLATLEACAGNQSEAARRLGLPRRTLVARLARLRGRRE